MDRSHIPSATPTSAMTSIAKRTSQYLSGSNHESLVESVKKLSVQDDEQASNTKASLNIDKSPTPAGRPPLKKKSRQSVQANDDGSQSSMKNSVSNHKNKDRNSTWTDERPSAQVQHSLNLGGVSSTPRSSKRKSAETLSPIITPIDNKGKEVDADSSGATAQELLDPVQYRQKATLPASQASHKRSVSAPKHPIKRNIITQDTPIAPTSSRDSLPTQTHKLYGTDLLAPTCCSSRCRSASAAIAEHTVRPHIEFSSPGNDGRVPGAFPNDPIDFSKVSFQSPSEPPERTPDLHPDKTPKSAKLEHMHPIKKNNNDVKNEILRLIRRQKSKPAAESTLNHGFVYIFKSDRFPGHVKIGSTVRAPETRMKEWGTVCKFKAIQVTDQNDKAFMFCRIVEQIVHAELYNEQRRFFCDSCKTKDGRKVKHILAMAKREKGAGETELDLRPTEHGEWFEVSETKALEVVNKWRDWMIHQEPYNKDAMLLTFWVWKYNMGTKRMKGTEADWEAWRLVGWLDIFRYNLYEFERWLGEVSPLLQKLVNTPGSAVVLAVCVYFSVVGVNWKSCVKVGFAFCVYRCVIFKFC